MPSSLDAPKTSSADDPVVVVPYDPRWPRLCEEERARIEGAIGPWALEIEHVGSTAAPEKPN